MSKLFNIKQFSLVQCQKQFYFKQFSLAYARSLDVSTQFDCQKKCLFQAIQFSQTVLIQTIQFNRSMQLVLFNP